MIEKAGFKSWPKLFHNLRAACQTGLAGEFSIHVVREWPGNIQAVTQEFTCRSQTTISPRRCSRGKPRQAIQRKIRRTPEIKKPLQNRGF